jgi:hypothetical protein
MALEDIGVRAVIENLGGYLSGMTAMSNSVKTHVVSLGDLTTAGKAASTSMTGIQTATKPSIDALRSMVGATDDETVELVGMTGAMNSTKTGMDKFKEGLNGMLKGIQDNQKEIRNLGIAITALGVAGSKFTGDAMKVSASVATVALETGLTEGKIRDLTTALSDASFKVPEVLDVLSQLGRAGIEDATILRDTALALNTLGDAVGISAGQLTDTMIPIMNAFGLKISDVSAYSDQLTYMVHNSTISIGDFSLRLPAVSGQLAGLGVSLTDTMAALMALSAGGLEGRYALTALSNAAQMATDEQIPFEEALIRVAAAEGKVLPPLQDYKTALDGATGSTKDFSDAANLQYTFLDDLKVAYQDLSTRIGFAAEAFNTLFGVMTLAGPMIMFLSMLPGAVTTLKGIVFWTKAQAGATWAWFAAQVALDAALLPVLLILALVVAAIAAVGWAIYVIIDNWDELVIAAKMAWNFIVGIIKSAVEFIVKIWDAGVALLRALWDRMKDAALAVPRAILAAYEYLRDKLLGIFEWIANTAIDTANAAKTAWNWLTPGSWGDMEITKHVNLTGAAYGGYFPNAQPVMVGERGPEVVMMPAGATVQPNTYNTNYNVNANYSNPQQPQSISLDLEYIRMRSRGG